MLCTDCALGSEHKTGRGLVDTSQLISRLRDMHIINIRYDLPVVRKCVLEMRLYMVEIG